MKHGPSGTDQPISDFDFEPKPETLSQVCAIKIINKEKVLRSN
jgi:serine/threonine protein kinase